MQATNETICTCRYCQQPIQPGKGIYIEDNWEKGQMGWVHYPGCKWYQLDAWKQANAVENDIALRCTK